MTDCAMYAVTPAQMEAFGFIIQWFARHEVLIQMTASTLIGAELTPTVVLMAGLGYSGKRDALLSLLRALNVPDARRERIRWFMGELHKHNNLRNAIAHSSWTEGTRPDSIKPVQAKIRGGVFQTFGYDDDEPDYTVDELGKIADELARLYNQYFDYLASQGLLPSMAQNMAHSSSPTSSSEGSPSPR